MRLFGTIPAILIACLLGLGNSHAESLGPYVHGETRMGDEDLLFCVADAQGVAVELAERHNAWVLEGRDAGSDDYQVFLTLSQQAVSDRKCFRADRLDHRSFMTLYEAPTTLAGEALYSVVGSHYAHKGLWLKGYVLTFEPVPPLN